MYLDLALREPKPIHLANSRSAFDRNHLRMWEHSNRLSLMIIHRDIPEVVRGIVPDEISSAKDYLAEFEKHFVENDKVKTRRCILETERRNNVHGMKNLATRGYHLLQSVDKLISTRVVDL
ncbi:hypothetical protein QQ045_027373 [Rhodiola kirilowii]